ncbi:MAG: hypothetical protein ACNA8R_01575 [Nitriliruptoraceae bacterium]
MSTGAPPAYAWDWVARQRLVWRDARARLAATRGPVGARYAAVQDRADVLPLLRADYPTDAEVRRALHGAIAEVAFGGRTDVPFAQLGFRSAPRGLRWWWTAVTGEELDRPRPRADAQAPTGPRQLRLPELAELDPQPALDDVAEGYGDRAR